MVKLLMPSRRSRLVWRGVERIVFVPGSVLAICRLVLVLVLVLVVPSRRRGSYSWRLASMSCPSCLLSAFYHYSSRLASRFSSRRASRHACLTSDVFFLCLFVSLLVSSSRCPVSPCVSGGGGSSCAACLTCPDGVLLISSYRFVGRDGERSALMRLRNLFHGIFMNWE